jgi:DNA-binding phage protein
MRALRLVPAYGRVKFVAPVADQAYILKKRFVVRERRMADLAAETGIRRADLAL